MDPKQAIISIAAKKRLNSRGAKSHPCRSSCSASNQSDHVPSSIRTRALMPSWDWQMLAFLGGTPSCLSTDHSSSRSTESEAFVRSIQQAYSGVGFIRASSCRHRTTNITSTGEHFSRKTLCSSGRMSSRSK
ncbi:unnamed protein product [Pylaiella littoralis]